MIAGQIEIQMQADITRIAKNMNEVKSIVGDAMGAVKDRIGSVLDMLQSLGKTALLTMSGIGALASFNAFRGIVTGAIEGTAALHDLSIQTGMSVAALGQFRSIGGYTETSIDMITGASMRLSKSLATTSEDGKGVALALRALGIDFDTFRRLSPDQQLLAVAQRMNDFRDGTEKTAAAMLIYGKEGAKMLPFLGDLAEAHPKVTAALSEQAVETKRLQAAMADAWGDNLTKIRKEADAWQKDLGMSMLPALYEVSEAWLKMERNGQGLKAAISQLAKDGTLTEWARNAVIGLTYLVDIGQALLSIFPILGNYIAAAAAASATAFGAIGTAVRQFIEGDYAKAWDTLKGGVAGTSAIFSAVGTEISNIWGQKLLGETFRDRMADVRGLQAAAEDARPELRGLANAMGDEEAAKKAEDLAKKYRELIAASKAHVTEMEAQAAGADKLTAGEKKLLEMQAKVEAGTLEYSHALYAETAAQLQAEAATEKRLRAQEAEAKASAEAAKARDQQFVTLQQSNESLKEQIATQLAANAAELTGVDYSAAMSVAKLREAAVTAELNAIRVEERDLNFTLGEQYRENAKRLRALADAQEQGATAKSLRAEADQVRNIFNDFGRIFEDALMNGADSALKNIKAEFERTAIRMVVQGVGNLATNAITGQSGGGVGSWLGSANGAYGTGSTLAYLAGGAYGLTGASAGASAASLTYANAVGAAGGDSLGALISANGGWSGVSAGTASSGAASAASAIPIIGWIVAALLASDAAYKGGNNVGMLDTDAKKYGVGAFETHKYKTLSKLGFSDKWANILSGAPITARLFGHKASSSGYGIGSVVGGDFVSDSVTPFQYGDNTLGTGRNQDLEGLSSDLIANLALSASQFGGKLQEGLRVGSFTDRDREGKVSALLGYFGAQNTLVAGTQTGTGAFGVGGPTAGGQKIDGADFQAWVAEQMPVLLIQGLQQSDLADRFSTYFDSVAASTLTSDQASQMLATAAAVAQLTNAFTPLGGVFTQFQTLAVGTFDALAKSAGGFDSLTQSVQSYYLAFYSEAERTDHAWASITQTLHDAGVNVIPTTKAELRGLVDSLDLNTEGGQKAFVALMKVSGAVDQLATASAAAAEQVAKERLGLEQQLLTLQGNTVELRKRERDQLDASNRALYDQVKALEDQQQASAKATEAAQAAADAAAEAASQRSEAWSNAQGDALQGVTSAYQSVAQMISTERQRLQGEADQAVRDAQTKAEAGIRDLESQAQQIQRVFGSLLDSIANNVRKLAGEMAGDGGRGQALDMLRGGLAALRSGSSVDMDQLREAASTASAVSTAEFATRQDYERELASTADLLRNVGVAARGQMTSQTGAIAAQQVAMEKARDDQIAAIELARDKQLYVLDQQLESARIAAERLVAIDTGVQTVAGAIAQLSTAIAAAGLLHGDAPTPSTTGQWLRSGDTEVYGAAGGAVATRAASGATMDGTIIHGLSTTFSATEARAWVNDRVGAGDLIGIYMRAKAEGIDSSALDALMGWTPGTSLAEARRMGLAAFERGTSFVPNTGIALVHEGERILPAADNAALMDWMSAGTAGIGADAWTDVVGELQALREEVAQLRNENMQGHHANASANAKTARLMEDVVHGGESISTRAEA